MRRIIPIIGLMLVAVAGTAIWFGWLDRFFQNVNEDTVTIYGNIEIRDAHLAFNEQEHIQEILVEEGQQVEVGQVLARLQDDRIRNQLAEAEAQLEAQQQVVRRLVNGVREQEIVQRRAEMRAAQARLANAQRVADRLQRTVEMGASSERALDDAMAAVDVAEAEVLARREALDLALEGTREETLAEARAQLKVVAARIGLLETRLDDTVLRSPSAGIIQSRILEKGEMGGPLRPAFILALLEKKWVRGYLPEPQLGYVQEGLPAKVVSDSFPDKVFDAWVGFISPTAEFTPKSVQTDELRTQLVYEVRVWVEDPQNQLRLGAPVTVHINREATPGAVDDETAASELSTPGRGETTND